MRLPTCTQKQKQREDSRQFCEDLYQAFLDGRRIVVVVTPETAHERQLQVAANTRHFWKERGFMIHTQQGPDKCGLFVWLAQHAAQQAAA